MEYKLGEEARCAVIGYGSWATAIVSLLVKNEKEVWWYVRNGEVLESLATEGYNPKYLNDVKFDTAQIRPSSDINEVVSNAKIIIMAAPSAFLKDFLEPLTVSLKDKFVVSAIKGIIPGDYKTVVEYLHDRYEAEDSGHPGTWCNWILRRICNCTLCVYKTHFFKEIIESEAEAA